MAAQAEGIPLVIHAHELPTDNTPLCTALAASPGVIRLRTLGLATCIIANSQAVADFFSGHRTASVPVYGVPNTLDMAPLLALPSCPALANTSAPLRVGMLSSHQPEKGLEDAAALATLLASLPALGQPIELHLYGPETPALAAIRSRQARGELTNLTLHPYVASPAQALAELDVVLNLSSVKESFGRTVLEAMTAGRAVVCYRWGALPELVMDNVTGFMAEHGDIETIAHHLRYLATHREALARIGQAGQQHALAHYTPRQYVKGLTRVYRHLLADF
jgi:glycosyltransferase involved in cell wall biosynthesis